MTGGWSCWGIQIFRCALEQQTGLVYQHQCCVLGRDEQTVFPAEAQILQCVQQDARDLLPVWDGKCHLLCCSLLGEQHQCQHPASGINKLIGKAGTVIGLKLETFESVMSKRSLNCSPSWTILPTLSIKHSRDSGAHSPKDWFSSAVTKNGSRSLSYCSPSDSLTVLLWATNLWFVFRRLLPSWSL